MLVGVPKEIKDREDRVGLVPSSVGELVKRGHRVLIEKGAGTGAGFDDGSYTVAGGEMVIEAREVWSRSDLIIKVKEPQATERGCLREDQVLFTYLHLAPDP